MATNLADGGYAILSGILNEQAEDVIEVYAQNGIDLIYREEIVEWTTLTLQKQM
jgi:ribosomal protein L11 methyltransferase